ncbi:MAG: tyrosine-type recombinase/integrase [Bacteroidetes bacterium]|nr:tyrosine-type recombinase/integrase [Bacteroidota bacterium]
MHSCVLYFEQQSFSQPRIDRYKSMWKSGIVPFMSEKSIQYYDASVGEEYIRTHIAGSMVTPSQRDFIRSIYVLSEFQEKGTVSKRRCHPAERKLSGPIGLLMEQFLLHLKSLRRSQITIYDHRLYLHRFLAFIESKQILNVEEIKEEHIIIFVSTITNNNICVVSSLRLFFRYLFDSRVLSSDLSEVLRHYRWNKREKLPSVYTAVEVSQIESSIKREDATGKRNYAMMLLATRLGLRASDIAHLCFDNISWESSTIIFSQFKTGKKIELPLLVDVGEAIIDYLKYGRKRSESPKIFLYTRAPFTAMTNAAVAGTLGRIVDASGIDTTGRKHGAHAMRHSLASRFLENKESIPVISEALGHQNTDTTISYLRIDIESLRQYALDTPIVSERFYEQKGGVYYE